jgi:methionyl-tRNA synthetase
MSRTFYCTTPIYYVNERPHIGHLYSTTVTDVVARYHRLCGERVFFLTGTDEHAAKVVDAAAERGMATRDWADRNARAFQETFAAFGIRNDDFIRTSQARHTERVVRYVEQLLGSGDVHLGEYEGWYDAGQEDYVPESKAKEYDYRSPINGKPLVRKKEHNYFFRLSRYQEELLRLYQTHPEFVQPAARRNEMIARVREGLNDVPISRTGGGGWGIPMPGDPEHTVYVWIDALFNYLTAVDTDERRCFWPADLHLIAKDILWFHAVIWPALLLALRRVPGNEWIALPRQVYAHSFWIAEGKKMSKSLGNFIDLGRLEEYKQRFGLDALRYFLASQGPLGVNDADFADARFRDVYHADLANNLGNLVSRTLNMTARFADGRIPEPDASAPGSDEAALRAEVEGAAEAVDRALRLLDLHAALGRIFSLVSAANRYLDARAPWKAAKQPGGEAAVRATLYHTCDALYVTALLLRPFLPASAAEILRRLGCEDAQAAPLPEAASGGGRLPPGRRTEKGPPLFPRVDGPSDPDA